MPGDCRDFMSVVLSSYVLNILFVIFDLINCMKVIILLSTVDSMIPVYVNLLLFFTFMYFYFSTVSVHMSAYDQLTMCC